MKLRDKVVMIAEAGSASGMALIDRFAPEGARFILNSEAGTDALVPALEKLHAAGCPAIAAGADLCSPRETAALLDRAERELGTVDVLIHNRRAVRPAMVETCDEERFLSVLNANAKSAFVVTQAVGRQMAAKRSGKIVYIGSIHAEKPTGASFAYSVSQGAIKMLCREAALMLGRHGINVNLIELGPLEGDDVRFRSGISALYEDYRYKVPNAVLGTYADVANLALYLSSAEADFLNGADVRLDGGFLMHYMDHKMKRPQHETTGGAP